MVRACHGDTYVSSTACAQVSPVIDTSYERNKHHYLFSIGKLVNSRLLVEVCYILPKVDTKAMQPCTQPTSQFSWLISLDGVPAQGRRIVKLQVAIIDCWALFLPPLHVEVPRSTMFGTWCAISKQVFNGWRIEGRIEEWKCCKILKFPFLAHAPI